MFYFEFLYALRRGLRAGLRQRGSVSFFIRTPDSRPGLSSVAPTGLFGVVQLLPAIKNLTL